MEGWWVFLTTVASSTVSNAFETSLSKQFTQLLDCKIWGNDAWNKLVALVMPVGIYAKQSEITENGMAGRWQTFSIIKMKLEWQK